MRFWHKVLIGTLLITLLALDSGTYILVRDAYRFTKEREIQSARREQYVIVTNVADLIDTEITANPNLLEDTDRLSAIIRVISDYYSVQGITFSFYRNRTLIYSNAPSFYAAYSSILQTQEISVNDGHYLVISQPMDGYPELMLVYVRDISELDKLSKQISRIFIVVSVLISLILSIAIFLLVKRLTRPIEKLIATTKEIADGAYGRRAVITSRDEFGKLAENFNKMAESVEQKVEQLTESANQKEWFINNISHEMRTPLTSLIGYAGFLKNAVCSEDDRILAAEHLEESGIRLKKLSDKLLEMAALRGCQIERKPVDTLSLINGVKTMMAMILAEKNLTLLTDILTEVVYGDETLLLSLFCNLVENAARASSEGKRIWISIYGENEVILEVRDEGCGIPPDQIDRVLQPFYRVDPSRSRKSGGAGLGLSLCVEIVRCLDADMKIESSEGIGTVVRVKFTNPQ